MKSAVKVNPLKLVHLAFAPALDGVAWTPRPTMDNSGFQNRIATLSPAAKDDEASTKFIGAKVKRSVVRKCLGNFINAKIALSVIEPIHNGVVRALINEGVRRNSDVLNGDEMMRIDCRPEE